MDNTKELEVAADQLVISSEQLLEHWQGHRRLTRKLIEAFPDEHFFSYALGGMRPCSELIDELLQMADGGIQGVVSRQWHSFGQGTDGEAPPKATTKEAVLAHWDRVTEQIDALWPQIPLSRFQEVDLTFNLYEGTIYWFFLYLIDNEIHHRAQAYVYLRTLGVEPPAFWDRG